MFLSLKMLYLADKKALESWGKTITGDKMVSMPKGPVLSTVHDLFKGVGEAENLDEWNSYFGETVNNKITLLKDAEIGELSQDEIEALAGARAAVESCSPWSVADWLHKTCPEWEDPQGSSRPIRKGPRYRGPERIGNISVLADYGAHSLVPFRVRIQPKCGHFA
jgi:hypothetical protein